MGKAPEKKRFCLWSRVKILTEPLSPTWLFWDLYLRLTMWAFSQEVLPFSLRFSPSPSGPHMHSHWSVTGFTLTGSTALVLEQTVFTQMLQEELGFLPLETSSWTKFKLLTSLKFWLCLIWIFPSRWEYPSASSASNASPLEAPPFPLQSLWFL